MRYVCNLFKNDLISEDQVVEITENIITSAMALAETYKLRGYDAVHLAAGYAVNTLCTANSLPSVIFV
ncbi:MAG: hypothetical protein PUP92_00320 [Rhizonema sp. PD38]|nr:hypothetical protein [Rhizonema sp. PD38]